MVEIKIRRVEDMSDEERELLRRHLTSRAVEVKAPQDSYLEGKDTLKHKPRGKVIKGGNNDFLRRMLSGK